LGWGARVVLRNTGEEDDKKEGFEGDEEKVEPSPRPSPIRPPKWEREEEEEKKDPLQTRRPPPSLHLPHKRGGGGKSNLVAECLYEKTASFRSRLVGEGLVFVRD